MNRRELQRRTALAEVIAYRWFIHRQILLACREMYSNPRPWSMLGPRGLSVVDFDA